MAQVKHWKETAGQQPVSSGSPASGEAGTHLEVVNAPLSSHHHLTGGDALPAGAAGPSVSKQPAKAAIQGREGTREAQRC